MSTIFNIRSLKLPGVSRTALLVGPVGVRRRAPGVLPFDPLGLAGSGACDAPDELVCQCVLKLGILRVAAVFPAGECSDHRGPEDGVGSVAGVADRELVGGGTLVEDLSKWRDELRVLGGHQGS